MFILNHVLLFKMFSLKIMFRIVLLLLSLRTLYNELSAHYLLHFTAWLQHHIVYNKPTNRFGRKYSLTKQTIIMLLERRSSTFCSDSVNSNDSWRALAAQWCMISHLITFVNENLSRKKSFNIAYNICTI